MDINEQSEGIREALREAVTEMRQLVVPSSLRAHTKSCPQKNSKAGL